MIPIPGLINLDFADVQTIMSEMGMALLGTGTVRGESRAIKAGQKAISSPLLEASSIEGARGVLLNITGGPHLTLFGVNEASSIIRYDARGAAINVWPHHWVHPSTHEESETIGTFYVHWDPPALYQIETDEGLSLEALMQEFGRLELKALGRVTHGDVPQGEHTR